jgi:hypothetical protein
VKRLLLLLRRPLELWLAEARGLTGRGVHGSAPRLLLLLLLQLMRLLGGSLRTKLSRDRTFPA